MGWLSLLRRDGTAGTSMHAISMKQLLRKQLMHWYQQGSKLGYVYGNIDSLGVQGRNVQVAGIDGCSQIWAGPLSGNRFAVALWSRCSKVATITASWAALGPESGIHVSVMDLWTVHFHSICSILLCTVDRLHPPMGFGRSVNPK